MEEMGELIGKGFETWRNNLNLCLPFVLNLLASILVLVPLAAMALTALGPIEDLEIQSPEELLNRAEESAALLAGLAILAALMLTLVSSFFTASSIGMARQALETGRSTTAVMWESGRRHLWNMFLVSVLIWALTVLGAVFMLPGAWMLYPQYQNPETQSLAVLVGGMMLTVIYALILSLVLAVAPYALVIESLGPVKSLKESMAFFRYNKFDVFLLWLIVLAISIGLQMIGGSYSASADSLSYQPLSALTGLINLLVLSPLATVWWARLYMSRKGKLSDLVVNDPW
ncbi:MAG: hypothetical protein HPY61_00775 [Methanotrichaceae archaeon]|nr:hypothetical protein [Methanotrichaceae archaeon]